MSRTTAICLLAAVSAVACARSIEPSTTTVTSGTTSGVRVTNVRTDSEEAAIRLADEMCSREASCNHIGEDAHYRTEEACLSDQSSRAPSQLSRWTCIPGRTQAGFETCLAAIRSERCETPLQRADVLSACRNAAVCGP